VLAPSLTHGALRVTQGRRVVEIRPPVDWDKGHAIAWFFEYALDRKRPAQTRLIYLGDDRTDEDAFQAVNRLGGISVFVGRPTRRTAATYRLKDPHDVCVWLASLNDARRHAEAKLSDL